MNHRISSIVAVTTLTIFSATSQSANWEPISGQAVMDLLADKTGVGGSYSLYYGPDGKQKGRWGGFVYTGKYYVNDKGHFCNVWLDWDKGKQEGCWSVSHKSGKEVKFEPESGRADKPVTFPLKEGNAHNL